MLYNKPQRIHQGARAKALATSCSTRQSRVAKPVYAQQKESSSWEVIFDLRERETEWTDENRERFIRLIASERLDIPLEEVEIRLEAIKIYLPTLGQKLTNLHPTILADILRDPTACADRIITLRTLLPTANLDAILSGLPQLLMKTSQELEAEVQAVQKLLDVSDLGPLAQRCPLVLDSEGVGEVLRELERLMPGSDVKETLKRDPGWMTRVERGQKRMGANPDQIDGAIS